MKDILSILTLTLLVLFTGCDDDDSEDSPDPLAGLTDYYGDWRAHCDSGSPKTSQRMVMGEGGFYFHITEYYTGTCGEEASLTRIDVTSGRVTAVGDNDTNSDYDDIFVTQTSTRLTAYSATGAEELNDGKQCGKEDWTAGSSKTFDESDNGQGSNHHCFQTSSSPTVKLGTDSFAYNGRGGFDGQDPDEITFTRSSTDLPLHGLISGKEWISLSGSAKPGISDASTLSFSFIESRVSDPCDSLSALDDRRVIFSAAASAATITLGTDNTITFNEGSSNNIATEGELTITTVSDTEVKGSMDVTFDSDNTAQGTFTAKRCSS